MSDYDLGGRITVRGLAEGAMMTALSLILAVISTYVPILSLVSPLLFPVPMAFVVLRHGIKLGLISAISTFLLSAMLLSLPNALYLIIMFGFLGLFWGWCFRLQKNAIFTLLGGVLLSSAAVLLLLLVPSFILGMSLSQLQDLVLMPVRDLAQMAGQPGGPPLPPGMTVATFIEQMEKTAIRLLPGVLIGSTMAMTLFCYLLMARVLRRFNYDIAKLPPFKGWRMDWRFLWVLIVVLGASSLGDRLQLDMVARIGDNLLIVFGIIFGLCGFSVLSWVFGHFKVPVFIQFLVVILVLQLFTGMMLVLVGVFDPLFNFRWRIEQRWEKRKL